MIVSLSPTLLPPLPLTSPVKCVFHATVSEDSSFGVIDITDFYLGSPMPSPEFLKLYTQDYRPELLDELGITPYIQVDSTEICGWLIGTGVGC